MGLRPLDSWDCGFEYRQMHGCLSFVSVVCCQVEVSETGSSLVQRNPTDCGVSECEHEASLMRTTLPTRASCTMGGRGGEERPQRRQPLSIWWKFLGICLNSLTNKKRSVSTIGNRTHSCDQSLMFTYAMIHQLLLLNQSIKRGPIFFYVLNKADFTKFNREAYRIFRLHVSVAKY